MHRNASLKDLTIYSIVNLNYLTSVKSPHDNKLSISIKHESITICKFANSEDDIARRKANSEDVTARRIDNSENVTSRRITNKMPPLVGPIKKTFVFKTFIKLCFQNIFPNINI